MKGRTIGEFVREEICDVIGADFYFGVPSSEYNRIANIKITPLYWTLLQSFLPESFGRRIMFSFLPLVRFVISVRGAARSWGAKNDN